jgi:hypothetical protein
MFCEALHQKDDAPVHFIAALDRETENLRATLAAEAEKEDASKSKIIVPDIS